MARSGPTAVRFRERSELLDFLLEVSAVTSETLDLDRLLPKVADFVSDVIPHDLFAILLYNEKLHGLRIRYARGHRDEVVRNLVIPLNEGITGAAAATRQPIMAGDVRTDARYLNALDAVCSELAVPMMARNKLVGVIDLQSTQLDAYSEQDRALLRLLANRVAAAIDNARLYRRVERQSRTMKTLLHLSQEFSNILLLDELLGKIAGIIRHLINYDAFSVLLVDSERRVLRHRFSQRFDERVKLDNIPLGKGITGAAAESREPVRVEDTLADPRYIASHPDIRSEVAVPLIVQDRVVGVMDLESERLGFFTEDHVRTLTLLAPQVASSVENARLYEQLAQREQRMEEDLRAARKVQSVLLPREAPDIPGLEIAIGLRPAREISGDIYDFAVLDENYSAIAFGDVSGKGAAAALYGALVSGLLRTLTRRGRGPGALMKLINHILLERKVDATYVTLDLLLWDSASRKMTISNAGALPPMIIRGGEHVRLHMEGIPLGLLGDRDYDEVEFQAQPGDVIMLYSDGLEDQTNLADEPFGHPRILRVLKRVCAAPVQDIVGLVFAEIDAFKGDAPPFDDQTMVVMKVTGPAT